MQRQLTNGEKAMGIIFNPGGHEDVNTVKRMCADLYDKIEELRSKANSGGASRYYSIAITHLEIAQMEAVKAITWQYN